MALLHKNLFASKWVQALSMAFGASFSADSSFALLYVMYNPVCRRDVLKKHRTANKMLAEALYPVYKEYSGDTHHLGFYIKSAWAFVKFVVKNRSLADCNPLLVLEASRQPHAVIFKDVNRLIKLVEHYKHHPEAVATSADQAYSHNLAVAEPPRGLKQSDVISSGDNQKSDQENSVTHSPLNTASNVSWLQRIQNILKRSNKVAPSIPGNFLQRYGDAPKLFVDEFESKRQFLSDNIEEEARLSLLTFMMFPNADDFGSSSDCQQFLHQFLENLDSFRKLFGATFRLTKDLEDADSAEKRCSLSRKERFVRRVSDLLFGDDMKLLRSFHSLSEQEAMKLYQLHDFPDLDLDDFKIPSASEILEQLLAADNATPFQKSGISCQIQASEDGSYALEPVIQHSQTSGPSQVNSVPVYESDHVAGVFAPRSNMQLEQNTHHKSEIELTNKNADPAVAAARLHVKTLEVPH